MVMCEKFVSASLRTASSHPVKCSDLFSEAKPFFDAFHLFSEHVASSSRKKASANKKRLMSTRVCLAALHILTIYNVLIWYKRGAFFSGFLSWNGRSLSSSFGPPSRKSLIWVNIIIKIKVNKTWNPRVAQQESDIKFSTFVWDDA